MSGFLPKNNNTVKELNKIVLFTEKKAKRARASVKKAKWSKKERNRLWSSSSSASLDTLASLDLSDSELDSAAAGRRDKGKPIRSGYYDKAGSTKLALREWYAHAALDDELGETDHFSSWVLIC